MAFQMHDQVEYARRRTSLWFRAELTFIRLCQLLFVILNFIILGMLRAGCLTFVP